MTEAIRRSSFKNFWSKFSHRCDNTVMMLNKSADEFEADDRADIISSLPDLHGKDIVDIGAGIGQEFPHFVLFLDPPLLLIAISKMTH